MEEKIKALIMPVVTSLGLELFEISLDNEGKDLFLRIYLDKPEGISINEVVAASQQIAEVLDLDDPITNEYFLEVSSPGAEKPLRTPEEIANAIDKYIRIELTNPQEGLDSVEGYLVKVEDNQYVLNYLVKNIKKDIIIDGDNIKKARLAIKF